MAEPSPVQLQRQIEALVRSGALPAGTCMPSERNLADALQIGRGIVRRCYTLLRDAQLLYSQTSRYGTIVRGVPSQSDPGGFAGQAQEPPPERVLDIPRVVAESKQRLLSTAVWIPRLRAE